MDDTGREALLARLQALADGPRHTCEIREQALGRALWVALMSLTLVAMGAWLVSLPLTWRMQAGQWLCWIPGLLVLGTGLAGLVVAAALRRRHGKTALVLSPDTLQFANANGATPWHRFDGFELEQRPLSLALVLTVAAGSSAPVFRPTHGKSLSAPDARAVAGGLRVRLWLCNPMLDGQRLDLQELTSLLYDYLEAAQARRTLGELFPAVQRPGVVRHSTGQ